MLLVIGFVLALGVFGGITALHRSADHRMAATRLVSVVAADLDRLQVMPWDAQEQLGPVATEREMHTAEAQLRRDLRTLSADASADNLSGGITDDVAADTRILERQRQRIIAKDMPAALAENGRSDLVHADLRADLTEASAKYAAASKRGRLLATEGSGLLLLVLFLAFATTLARLVRWQRKHAEMEARLRQAHKMEAVGQLAGGVAHDFNNLLTAIGGYAGLLPARIGDDDVALRYIGEIERASQHAANLTGHLLAFSRKQRLQPRTVDLNTVVNEARSMIDRLITADVDIDLSLDPDLPLVHVDPTQITGVLLNLCTNAQDAMPNGGRILLETRAVEVDPNTAAGHSVTAGSYVALSVTDSGSGIDEAVLERIFDPFFTTKPVGRGTGLGLASAYGVAHQSSGFITAESPGEQGARFTVYLPAAPVPGKPVVPKASHDDSAELDTTVLVVEDQPAVRNLAAEILAGAGCRVVTAATGLEGLQRFEEHPGITVLLTDVVMPGTNGPELADRLRRLSPQLSVLFMSGYTGEALAGRGIAAGANLVEKPFTARQLLDAVRRSLDAGGQIPA